MSEKKSHRKVFIIGGIVAGIMFAFCFAIVPFYSLLCKATGINPSFQSSALNKPLEQATADDPDLSREVAIQFTATNHMGMPWEFYPETKIINVHPGQSYTVYFYAKNPTEKDMKALAIPSMTPTDAIAHFHKMHCFCFNQQSLKKGEKQDFKMIFRVDKDLPKEIHTITLAYTLFDTTPKETKKG